MHMMLEGQSLPDNPSSTASTLLAVLLPRSRGSRQVLEALLMIYTHFFPGLRTMIFLSRTNH
jgi:hypothetical protein